MLVTYKDASYRPKGQGERGYEATKLALLALIVVSITLLGVLLLNNKTLCDVSFRSGGTEVVAHMAYASR
ncbi:hypothetical protein DOE63_02725 [Salmonella enterica subsp. diarizonae serovar 59:z10:-]|nr:hypothetical protein DOE63_02725 [Salmonella enterica subsp. diarizonae serovar 59:z10:-]